MGCGCGNRKPAIKNLKRSPFTVLGNYKFLNQKQIAKRLELFKKFYCEDCDKNKNCDYGMYIECGKGNEVENNFKS